MSDSVFVYLTSTAYMIVMFFVLRSYAKFQKNRAAFLVLGIGVMIETFVMLQYIYRDSLSPSWNLAILAIFLPTVLIYNFLLKKFRSR